MDSATRDTVMPDFPINAVLRRDDEAIRCPFAAFAHLRQDHPVVWSDALGAWLVSRYDDIRQVLKDPVTFSSRCASGRSSVTGLAERIADDPDFPEETRRQAARRVELSKSNVLLTADPPLHKRQRGLVAMAFTPRRVKEMEPEFQAIVDSLIDAFPEGGPVDIVRDFAMPLPMTVIARILGVPHELMPTFKKWTIAFTKGVGALDLPREELIELFADVDEFYDYFTAELDKRRREPQDDLLTDLLQARMSGEESLSEHEILQMLVQFLVAGNETTTNLIGSTVKRLIDSPDLMASVRSDLSRVPVVVEETLRLEAPAQGLFRLAMTDVELGGQQIRDGDMLYLMYSSGNRDEAAFPEPEEIKLDGSRSHHLAFGRGEHVCLGSNLARRESAIAITTLLRRVEGLAHAGLGPTPYMPSFALRGPLALPVTFTRRS
ncbi:cytochrome P450 [Streptomyces sp. JNUCC 63]